MPNISVIIPTCNRLDLLKRTLESLEKQSVDSKILQVIIVDDASTDGTMGYLENYKSRYSTEIVLFPKNRGRSATRNAGEKKATGRILLFIDGDMEFGPDLIKGHLLKHSSKKLVILGRVLYEESLPYRGYQRYIQTRGANKLPYGKPLPGRYFLSGHVSMPSTIFQTVGGYDEEFQAHGGEDLDLGMRIVKKGYTIVFEPDLVMKHLHIRHLNQVLNLAFEYGRSTVPRLVEKHGQLYKELRLDFLDGGIPLRLVRKLILSAPVYQIVKVVGLIMNHFQAPAILYNYLLFRNYFMGYWKACLKGTEVNPLITKT